MGCALFIVGVNPVGDPCVSEFGRSAHKETADTDHEPHPPLHQLVISHRINVYSQRIVPSSQSAIHKHFRRSERTAFRSWPQPQEPSKTVKSQIPRRGLIRTWLFRIGY